MFKFIDLNKKNWQIFTVFFIAAIWGTSFILMKKGLQSFTNIQVAALRMFFAFIFFLPVIITKIRFLKKEHIKSLLIVGFIGNFIPAFLFTTAQTEISSSLAGMLNSVVPVFVMLIGIIFYKLKPSGISMLGVGIGLVGALGLLIKNFDFLNSGISILASLIILAAVLYGISTNEVKNKLKELDGALISAFAFLFIGPVVGCLLLFTDFSVAIATPYFLKNLLSVILLSLFSSVIAVVIFNILIKKTSALFAASTTYIIPIFAVIWGLFDGENINNHQILAGLVVFLGVYLVNK